MQPDPEAGGGRWIGTLGDERGDHAGQDIAHARRGQAGIAAGVLPDRVAIVDQGAGTLENDDAAALLVQRAHCGLAVGLHGIGCGSEQARGLARMRGEQGRRLALRHLPHQYRVCGEQIQGIGIHQERKRAFQGGLQQGQCLRMLAQARADNQTAGGRQGQNGFRRGQHQFWRNGIDADARVEQPAIHASGPQVQGRAGGEQHGTRHARCTADHTHATEVAFVTLVRSRWQRGLHECGRNRYRRHMSESIRYFARRVLNPFRGVAQYVEVEGASAVSRDGLTWHLYGNDGHGWLRPIGVWEVGRGQTRGIDLPPRLRAGLKALPDLPFAPDDALECWLLDTEGAPLALLASAAQSGELAAGEAIDLFWHPFVETYTGFDSAALRAAGVPQAQHVSWLAEAINSRAGAPRRTRWLAAGEVAAPLIVSGNNLLEYSAIADYHSHLAPLLLACAGLDDHERATLERAAFTNPEACARAYRLWPKVIDAERLQATRVAARLCYSLSDP